MSPSIDHHDRYCKWRIEIRLPAIDFEVGVGQRCGPFLNIAGQGRDDVVKNKNTSKWDQQL